MSGYGNKGPGWGRGPMPPHLMGNDFGGGGMLQQGIPLQQQGMGLAGMAPGMPVTTQGAPVGITYPAPRAVNPGGFPPGLLQQQQQQQAVVMGGATGAGGPGGPGQRVFTGTVTKLHDSFGFVDDEVFFQTSVCKGQVPKVQDRVLVEASYNPNMPFKWNATRVQVLPNQSVGGGGPGGGFSGNMGRQNQHQQGGGGGGGFQPTNQLGSAFGNDGGPGGNRGGGGGGNNDRNTRFDGGMRNRNDNMRGGGGGGNNMRGGQNDMDMRGHGGNDRGQDRQRQRSPPRQRQRNNDREDRNRDINIDNTRDNRMNERPERPQRDWKEERDRDRDKDSVPRVSRKRSRSPSRRSRSPESRRRSRSRSRSPPRRRARATPRYNVSVPKVPLRFPASNVMDLKKRYNNLYIPSDFFNANHVWNEAYPIHEPFEVEYATSFHVFNKDLVESPILSDSKWQLEAPDADYTWVAKVMLLASPNMEDLYEKTCHFVDKDSRDRDDLVHPTRALKFLVGLKEKREVMAIGGPWSPSLDGPNPESEPTTLIKTAIRNCGALTGIDLSSCTKWTKFLKIHYRRQASSSKPARTETVVIFFPDIWSVMPTKIEYDQLCEQYSQACKLKQEGKSLASLKENEEATTEAAAPADGEDEDMEVEAGEGTGEATHWSKLDTKSMKVAELRSELSARGQESKGVKATLTAKLQKCLDDEKETEEKKESEEGKGVEESNGNQEHDEASKSVEAEPSKEESNSEEVTIVLDDRQKEKLASSYKTPSNPCIFVHPNSKAKSGKFDCRVESLSVLLDYRTDDNKEGTFEVSLFAELFNEMMTRDSAFKIYEALANAAEKPKEDKKKEEKKDEKKEEKSAEVEEVNKGEATEHKSDEPTEDKTEENREASVEITEEKEKVVITKNKKLLFGCSYFDQSHCGYIESKDVEDILLTLELELSRAEIKKIANKLASKDQVNYRNLTDGEEGVEIEVNENIVSAENLAKGFKLYVPGSESADTSSGDGGMVTYKGSVVDVGKLQSNLDKSEKVRRATDLKFIELQKKFSSTRDSNEKLEKTRDKLQIEVKDLKKKVRGLEDDLKKSNDQGNKHFNILTDFYNKVKPIVAPPEKTEEKSTETLPMVNGVSETADDSDDLKIEAVSSEVKDEKEVSQEEEKS